MGARGTHGKLAGPFPAEAKSSVFWQVEPGQAPHLLQPALRP